MDPSVVARAWERRAPFHRDLEFTNAYRLLDGREEGAEGWVVDRYGDAALVQRFGPVPAAEAELSVLVDDLVARMGTHTSVFLKERRPGADGGRDGRLIAGPEPLRAPGDPLAGRRGRVVVREEGLFLGVDLSYGMNTGLFLDARPMRRWVRGQSEGRRVLNLFSYTASFGVAAAVGGCRSVTNVDVVPSALERGRANFALNDLPQDGRTHLRSEVSDFLKRARKRDEKWDGIILDPPPVSTQGRPGRAKKGRNKGFVPGVQLGRLIELAQQRLAPDGWLLVLSAARGEDAFERWLPPGKWPAIARDIDFPGDPCRGLRARILGAWSAAPETRGE